jgi:hypothetical protein
MALDPDDPRVVRAEEDDDPGAVPIAELLALLDDDDVCGRRNYGLHEPDCRRPVIVRSWLGAHLDVVLPHGDHWPDEPTAVSCPRCALEAAL